LKIKYLFRFFAIASVRYCNSRLFGSVALKKKLEGKRGI